MRSRLIVPLVCLALGVHCVPGRAVDQAQLETLELQCEAAREAKIKPLREAEIAKCRATKAKDREPGYCERYWRDYGNSFKLPNGKTRPRMFEDLPECVALLKARNEFKKK